MENLPFEVRAEIQKHLSYADKVSLHQALYGNRLPYVDDDPITDFAKMYLPFDWPSLSEMLKKTSSVIGGSTALRFFSYTSFEPNDLDIFGPSQWLDEWQTYFTQNGFFDDDDDEEMAYFCHFGKRDFVRGKWRIQYLQYMPGIKHSICDVDNTANACGIYYNEAICLYHNDVAANRTTVFDRSQNNNTKMRMQKLMERGYAVHSKKPWYYYKVLKLGAPLTISERRIALRCNKA